MLSIPNVKFFNGSRGPHGPDLPSPFGRKFQIPSFWFKMAENASDHNVYLSVLLNFFVDEDEDENKLFSDDNEEITSPDLDEPNFNEMKELKSSI